MKIRLLSFLIFLVSNSTFAMEGGGYIPNGNNHNGHNSPYFFSNPTQQMLQDYSLSPQTHQNTNQNQESESFGIIVLSNQEGAFSLGTAEMFELFQMIPSHLIDHSHGIHINLSTKALRILIQLLRNGAFNSNQEIEVSSANNVHFTFTAGEFICLLKEVPDTVLEIYSNLAKINLSTTALHILHCIIKAKSGEINFQEIARIFIRALSNERLELLQKEANEYVLKLLQKALSLYARFLEKPKGSKKSSRMEIRVEDEKKDKRKRDSSEDENQISIDENICREHILIGSTPFKKYKKAQAIVNGVKYKIVSSKDNDYDFGRFVLYCPVVKYSSVALDATLPILDAIVQEFYDSLEGNIDPEFVFIQFMRFLHANIDRIDAESVQRIREDHPVCRHFSLYAAVLLSKFFHRLPHATQWGIQIIYSRTYKRSDLKPVSGEGHVWNLITITTKDNEKKYYAMDPLNGFLVHIDLDQIREDGHLSGLQVISVNGDLELYPLEQDHMFHPYVLFTVEKFLHEELGITTLFSEENRELLDQIGDFIEARDTHGEETILIIRHHPAQDESKSENKDKSKK